MGRAARAAAAGRRPRGARRDAAGEGGGSPMVGPPTVPGRRSAPAAATVDVPPLARLCLALAYADEATAQVQAVGLLVKAPNTKLPIQSPWVAIMNRQTEIARELAAALALPPAQRSRAGMAPPRNDALPDDEWSI